LELEIYEDFLYNYWSISEIVESFKRIYLKT